MVVDWNVFCEELANDQSVEEYEDLDPEGLTDDDRVAHLQARLSHSLCETLTTVALLVGSPNAGCPHKWNSSSLLPACSKPRARGVPELVWLGLFPSVDASMVALDASGYHRCDAPLSHDAVKNRVAAIGPKLG